jgi:NAD(P)-dependent dehydrogenase (short-subunit alcohol dehydrogenase family)
MIDLEGRSILITGGASGIGLACAELAASLGARVTVADVAAGGELAGVNLVECDARDLQAIGAAVDAASDASGSLDGLITTVGGADLAPLDELSPERWREQLEFNLTTVYIACHAALPLLRADPAGAIVTIGSGYANLPGPDRAAYTAAKAGVEAFTRSLAAAAAPDRVRANCIAPGPTDTPRFREMNDGDEGVERVRRSIPLGEIPKPSDVANAAIFLLSAAARQITGQVIHVNGGLLMR